MKDFFHRIRRFWKHDPSGGVKIQQEYRQLVKDALQKAEPQPPIISQPESDPEPDDGLSICPLCGQRGYLTPDGHCWECDISYYS